MSLLLLLKPKAQGVVIPPEEPPAAPPLLLGGPRRPALRILRVRAGTARVLFRALAPELALELEGGKAGPVRLSPSSWHGEIIETDEAWTWAVDNGQRPITVRVVKK